MASSCQRSPKGRGRPRTGANKETSVTCGNCWPRDGYHCSATFRPVNTTLEAVLLHFSVCVFWAEAGTLLAVGAPVLEARNLCIKRAKRCLCLRLGFSYRKDLQIEKSS